jgi:hypothetical protein
VPFDAAFALVDGDPLAQSEALAMSVIFGEFEGGEFDWTRFEWKKKNG